MACLEILCVCLKQAGTGAESCAGGGGQREAGAGGGGTQVSRNGAGETTAARVSMILPLLLMFTTQINLLCMCNQNLWSLSFIVQNANSSCIEPTDSQPVSAVCSAAVSEYD